jgi:predicted restriction endonuclease
MAVGGEFGATTGTQLLLQPRGGARDGGPRNFQHSIRNGVALADLAADLGEDAEVLAALYPTRRLRLWGSTPTDQRNNAKAKALRDRREGDHVLFYADTGFFARARIVHLFRNPAAASKVWGSDADGRTWEHMMALDDVEEFGEPVPAGPILRALAVPAPLRSLTLAGVSDYARVAPLLPPASGEAAPAPRARLTRSGLFTALSQLSTHRLDGVPSRHQPLTLLWAIGQLAAGRSRLVEWREFRSATAPILERFGLPESRVSPEHPFWHLRGSGLWEVDGLDGQPTKTPRLTLLEQENPAGGFSREAARLLNDPTVRGRAVRTLLTHYLAQLDHVALLADVGLSGYDTATGAPDGGAQGKASRREVTAQRIVRDTQVAREVKALYDHQCQICGTQLQTSRGPYSEGAHIRGLGAPHNGPDHASNLMCLCPNDHVLFDTFTIYIDRHGVVRSAVDQSRVGELRQHALHNINPEHLCYHRQLCGYDE